MFLMRIGAPGAEKPIVRIDDDSYVDVSDVVTDFDESFFGGAWGGLPGLRTLVAERVARGEVRPFAGERIGAPIARPHQILCIGLNFSDHAAETGQRDPGRADPVHQVPEHPAGTERRRPDPARIDQARLGGRARHRDRRTHQLPTGQGRRGRAHRRLLRGQRRQRARLPDRARRPVVEGQVGRDVQSGRAVAGHAATRSTTCWTSGCGWTSTGSAGRPGRPRR